MRQLLFVALGLSLAGAGSALAQAPLPPSAGFQQTMRIQGLESRLSIERDTAARYAAIEQSRANVLDAERRADAASRAIAEASRVVVLPAPPSGAPPVQVDPGAYAVMPDATLAASNERVRAAAQNRP